MDDDDKIRCPGCRQTIRRTSGKPVIIRRTETQDGRPAMTIAVGTAIEHRCDRGTDGTWRTRR
jgi:hypothetical protein